MSLLLDHNAELAHLTPEGKRRKKAPCSSDISDDMFNHSSGRDRLAGVSPEAPAECRKQGEEPGVSTSGSSSFEDCVEDADDPEITPSERERHKAALRQLSTFLGTVAYRLNSKHDLRGTPAEGDLACLDHHAINVDPNPEATATQKILLHGLAPERNLHLWALRLLDAPAKKIDRFLTCSQKAWVCRDAVSNDVAIQCQRCGLRTCPLCRSIQRQRVAKKMDAYAADWGINKWRFLTLTMPHQNLSLAESQHRLKVLFKKFRQTPEWVRGVQYGCGFFEATVSKSTGEWHTHLHVVLRSNFLDYKKLCASWYEVLKGDALPPDWRSVDSVRGLRSYLAKYLGKPPAAALNPENPVLYLEWFISNQHSHQLISFGTREQAANAEARKKAGPPPAPKRERRWLPIGPLDAVVLAALAGDPSAGQALRDLFERAPLWRKRLSAFMEAGP